MKSSLTANLQRVTRAFNTEWTKNWIRKNPWFDHYHAIAMRDEYRWADDGGRNLDD